MATIVPVDWDQNDREQQRSNDTESSGDPLFDALRKYVTSGGPPPDIENFHRREPEEDKFQGPGRYCIISYQAPDLSVNSWGATMNAEPIKLYPKSTRAANQIWDFRHVGNKEYCIVNTQSGNYLTGNPDKKVIYNQPSSSDNPRSRWTVKYQLSQGRYETFFINCVDKSCGQLNVSGGKREQGAEIISYPVENGDNAKFYLERWQPGR